MNVDIQINYQRDASALISKFVTEKLNGDFGSIMDFDLTTVRDDPEYGNSDKHQGIEQMRICKAFYAIAEHENNRDITYDKLLFEKGYRMRLIATSADICHMYGCPNEEALHLKNSSVTFLENLDEFKRQSYTLANVYVEKIRES